MCQQTKRAPVFIKKTEETRRRDLNRLARDLQSVEDVPGLGVRSPRAGPWVV